MAAVAGLLLAARVLIGDPSGPVPEPVPDDVQAVAECDLPVCGALGDRLYCIEGYESQHGTLMLNRSSGARGWLQWLPGTARTWGVVIGDRWSEWSAAARIAAQGEAFFRSQWPVTARLCS